MLQSRDQVKLKATKGSAAYGAAYELLYEYFDRPSCSEASTLSLGDSDHARLAKHALILMTGRGLPDVLAAWPLWRPTDVTARYDEISEEALARVVRISRARQG